MMKRGETNIVRPSWILDSIKQTGVDSGRRRLLLPFEPKHVLRLWVLENKFLTTNSHMFFMNDRSKLDVDQNVDEFGDSFARDIDIEELRKVKSHSL